jgi:hypothetical protein
MASFVWTGNPPLAWQPLPLSISDACHSQLGWRFGQSRLASRPLLGRHSIGILRVALKRVPTPSGVPVGPRSVRGCRIENGTLRNDAIAHVRCPRRHPRHACCGRAGHPRLYFTRVHPMRRALMCLGRGNRFVNISCRSVDTCTPASFAAAFHLNTSWSGPGSLGASGDARRLRPTSSGRQYLRPDEPRAI